jgi:hypothetical protein
MSTRMSMVRKSLESDTNNMRASTTARMSWLRGSGAWIKPSCPTWKIDTGILCNKMRKWTRS